LPDEGRFVRRVQERGRAVASFRGAPRRTYHSPKRERASPEKRRRIRDGAETLFLRDGYFRTTTKAIAKHAGVAEMTVFLAFANKAALLSEIIRVKVRGDDQDTPMVAREIWQEMLGARPGEILTRFAALNGEIVDRTARILALAESAATADAELAARRDSSHAHIRGDLQQVSDALHKQGCLAPGITATSAADAIYALASPSTYLLLADDCGWSKRRYVEWLAATSRQHS
jgi:AcrR family transcriptional regulator